MAASREKNSRLRIEGTRNLMAAAKAAGVKRVVAQSIAFIYAAGPKPFKRRRSARFERGAAHDRRGRGGAGGRGAATRPVSTAWCCATAGSTARAPGSTSPAGRARLTCGAAAQAALLAMTRGAPGIYNIAEDDGALSIEKARRELGFDPASLSGRMLLNRGRSSL